MNSLTDIATLVFGQRIADWMIRRQKAVKLISDLNFKGLIS